MYNIITESEFLSSAEINEMTNGDFYVARVYNTLISNGNKVGIYNICSVVPVMYGIGTPRDLNILLSNKMCNCF